MKPQKGGKKDIMTTSTQTAVPRLKTLDSLAAQLNEVRDISLPDLNWVETHLQDLNIGIEVEAAQSIWQSPYAEEEFDDDRRLMRTRQESHWLAFANSADSWRIVVRFCETVTEDGDVRYILKSERPLVECARETQLAAAERIDDLLDCISKAAERKIAALSKLINN